MNARFWSRPSSQYAHSNRVRCAASLRRARRLLCFENLENRHLLAAWINVGPYSATNGQVENIANRPVTGAIHAVLPHPTDANVLYVGAVNGGVWRTTTATAPSPTWFPSTDSQSSQSIGALAFDTADTNYQTIWAGNGLYSSYSRNGGARDGLLKSVDGAVSWQRVNGGGVLNGKNISGIVAHGNTIVVSVNTGNSTSSGNLGIFRSIDGGATFSQVNNGTASNGLPFGRAYDVVADPIVPTTLYTSNATLSTSTSQGVYKSLDGGASWTRVSTPAMDAFLVANTSNVEISAGRFGEVYVAFINAGNLAALYRSPDGGGTWAAMDLPSTNEGGTDVGLHPGGPKGPVEGPADEIAGGQGSIHFSMAADPTDANIVYVGGDRQPNPFPNSIGANDFSGRLFRGNASLPAGSQFVHLTHSAALGPAGGGTASSSSPHADSRDMAFDANGNIIEGDDGGVYRRTSPRSDTGDWFSVIGNLRVTEMHDVAYDRISNIFLSGNQDTGTTYQATTGANVWTSVSTGDGGDVVVDELTLAASNRSIRYTSFQNLGSLRRRTYNSTGGLVTTATPTLTVTGGGAALVPAFRTALQMNAVAGSRLIIHGTNSVYESLNQGDTLTEVGPGLGSSGGQDAIAYGGRLNGVVNPDVLWVGAGSQVALRTTAGGSLTPTPSQPVTTTIRDLVIDPDNYQSAAVLVSNSIRWTTNAGVSWSNITGNLGSLTTDFRSLAFVPGIIGAIVAGTARGIFATSLADLGNWLPIGSSFPNVPVWELEYDEGDNLLVAGTLGRGAWSLANTTSEVNAIFPPYDFGDAPATYFVTSAQNGARHARVGPTLGSLRDSESDGLPSANALGDNNASVNDEDGVVLPAFALGGQALTMTVQAPSGGFLNTWFDTNLDGIFSAGEKIFNDQPLAVGANTLSAIVPSTAVSGNSFLRFRLTQSAGQAALPIGAATNGEVEDYAMALYDESTLVLNGSNVTENSAIGTLVGKFVTTASGTTLPYVYSLEPGVGDADNTAFTIVGDELRTAVPLDFETKPSYTVRVRVKDQGAMFVERPFTITVGNELDGVVVDRRVFYHRSTSSVFGDGSANPVGAIDPSKAALLPGQTASFDNYTNYEHGLNGILVDLASIQSITTSDLEFATWDGIDVANFVPTAAIPTISLIPDGGLGGADRVKIEFDNLAIHNTWLRVRVLATANTDLASPDVFYFGNAIADVGIGNIGSPVTVRVNASDTAAVRQNQSPGINSVGISNVYDVNKDGRVNATDTAIIRQNQRGSIIRYFTAPLSLNLFQLAAIDSSVVVPAVSDSRLVGVVAPHVSGPVASVSPAMPREPWVDGLVRLISAWEDGDLDSLMPSPSEQELPVGLHRRSIDAFFSRLSVRRQLVDEI